MTLQKKYLNLQKKQLNSNLSKLAIMGKYNITGKKEKAATYRGLVSPKINGRVKRSDSEYNTLSTEVSG